MGKLEGIRIRTGPDGYLADDGVSGTEWREGESSALRIVCSCNPMLLETPEESEWLKLVELWDVGPWHEEVTETYGKRELYFEEAAAYVCSEKWTNCPSRGLHGRPSAVSDGRDSARTVKECWLGMLWTGVPESETGLLPPAAVAGEQAPCWMTGMSSCRLHDGVAEREFGKRWMAGAG